MPIVYGKMYPEIDSAGLLNKHLRIFFHFEKPIADLPSQIIELCTLVEYLKSIEDSPISIFLYTDATIDNEILIRFGILPVKIIQGTSEEEFLRSKVKELDLDIVVINNRLLAETFSQDKELDFSIVDFEGMKKNAEVFVRGHDIPWSFVDPIWNMPWEAFYTTSDDFAKKTNKLYQTKFESIQLDIKVRELMRSLLLNRVSHICYTRDKLLFFTLQKKYSKRHKWQRQHFTFEATYYLSYYYFVLWGGIEQLSRILTKALTLELKDKDGKISENIGNVRYIAKIKEKSPEIASLYKTKEFQDWIKQLERSRHFVAHEGCAMLSPIVQEPEGGISDEEIEREIQEDESLKNIRMLFGEEYLKPMKELLRQNLRISKYKVMVDEVMVLDNKETKGKYIFKPLLNIEWDFNNFELIILKTFDALYSYLRKEN